MAHIVVKVVGVGGSVSSRQYGDDMSHGAHGAQCPDRVASRFADVRFWLLGFSFSFGFGVPGTWTFPTAPTAIPGALPGRLPC